MAKTALVAGSTGLIGGQLLELLLKDSYYDKIIAISRQPLELKNDKLINVVSPLDQLSAHADELKADHVYCCLGTTIKKAKTKAAFRAIDLDAPVALAKIGKENGTIQFLLVSALGANKSSGIFYNQVKGEVEEAIDQVGLTGYHIFQPSLLLGPRKEQRSGEDAAKFFYKTVGWLIPAKYQAIESVKVARAMLAFAKKESAGKFVHLSASLQSY